MNRNHPWTGSLFVACVLGISDGHAATLVEAGKPAASIVTADAPSPATRRATHPHRFAEDFRHLAAHSMLGTDFDSCTHNWATQGLNYYVVARLHWDPNRDVDAIIDDYCRAGFGPAAKTMRTYFDKLEAVYSGTAYRHEDSFLGFTDAVLAELNSLIAKASTEATDEPASLKRVEFIRVGTHWTEIEVRAHRLLADGAKPGPTAVKQVLDARYALMREIFAQHHLAVNVAYVSWGEDGLYGRLGWRSPQ